MRLLRRFSHRLFVCPPKLCACVVFFFFNSFVTAQELPATAGQTLSKIHTPLKKSAEIPTSKNKHQFSADTLLALLTAEIAGSRQQYDVALENYVQQAKITRDPQIAERATMIARYLKQDKTALTMSLIWVDASPNNKDALGNASLALMQAGRLSEAFDMSKRLKAMNEEPLFQNIAASATGLTPQQRERLLSLYKNQLQRDGRDEQLLVGIGLLLQQQGNFNDAMNYVRRALNFHPNSIPAATLQANLLHQLNRDREAITVMGNLLNNYPDNTSLRTQYAHTLTRYDLALAQQQFSILADQLPKDADIMLSLGIIAMERKDYKASTKAFENLLASEQHLSTAHFYLGKIAELKQDDADAIYNYLQVDRGNDFLPATVNLLNIFIRKGDFLSAQQHMDRVRARFPDQTESLFLLHAQALQKQNAPVEAEKVLNNALDSFPNSSTVLFARAMFYNDHKQYAETERDLRRIIQLEPNNAIALNSLGYLLADTSQRFNEAEALITKALRIQTDDPVIIDSLGWLHFRTGNYPAALRELRRAYEHYPSPAVAAHLGELLWVTGSTDEARQIWQQGIRQDASNDLILSTMRRLKAE